MDWLYSLLSHLLLHVHGEMLRREESGFIMQYIPVEKCGTQSHARDKTELDAVLSYVLYIESR